MSSTNKTTYYQLPQFIDTDLFNPLVDDNDAYDKIDTALHNIASAEASDASEIVSVKSRVSTAENDITALKTQNGNATLITSAKNLSGAVNELATAQSTANGKITQIQTTLTNKADKSTVNSISSDVSALKTTVGNSNSGLVKSVNTLTSKVGLGTAIYNYFKNRKVLILGDSNSVEGEEWRGRTWVTDFKELLNGTGATITNNSVSGRRVSRGSDNNNLVSTVNGLSGGTYDDIIIFLGINDWTAQAELGDIDKTSGYDYTKFAEALKYSIKKLETLYPKAGISLVTPLVCNYSSPTIPLLCYTAVMRNIQGNNKSLTVIDGFCAPRYFVNGTTATEYSKDGVHTSASYAPILAEYIAESVVNGGSPKSDMTITKFLDINSHVATGSAFIKCCVTGEVEVFIDATISASVYEGFIAGGMPSFARSEYGGINFQSVCIKSNGTKSYEPLDANNGNPYPINAYYSNGDRYLIRKIYHPNSMCPIRI